MKNRKTIYVLIGVIIVVGAACAAYVVMRPAQPKTPDRAGNPGNPGAGPPPAPGAPSPQPGNTAGANPGIAPVGLPTSFLGKLAPGGTLESSGHEQTYVVSYQVAFFRKTPTDKVPEESLSYLQLQGYPGTMAPYVFYGENVLGTSDAAHPESIAVHATLEGKTTSGYIDSAKLWLEPPLSRAESGCYMVLTDTAPVYVVPDPGSPSALSLLQGEVVDTVGQLRFLGETWIKARFNAADRPRYGFIQGDDVQALSASSVNQSVVGVREIPKQIRLSNLRFGESDRQRLSRNGFYIEPLPPQKRIEIDDMADAYRNESSTQFFVTSDLFLHAYHLIFDRMLQDIEEKKILPSVTKMSEALAAAAEKEFKAAPLAPAALREASLRNLIYFSVAAKLFNPGFAVPAAARSKTEFMVSGIQSAAGKLPSQENPVGADEEDFTQYKVRGHYEKNKALQRYFRGMMWFGRRNFVLSDQTQTIAAILLPAIVEEAHEAHRFETVDALTTYLIGRQDKYTLAGYRSVNRKIFGTETPGFPQLATSLEQNLAAFQQSAWSDLPPPRIVSVQTGPKATQDERLRMSAGLKFLGQRYVLDAYLLNQLSSPSVGSNDNQRNLPSALDVMMLLGSKAATEVQQEIQKQKQWPNYERQVETLKGVTEEQLAKPATFYDHWLYALKTLYLPAASKQLFASGEPWQYKSLNTGLASWTELKHDTILYAEQSAAELGDGSEFEIPDYAPPGPKGYVEPNPALFQQLGRSVDEMLGELKRADFITEEYVDKFTSFRELARRAEAIAQKEVNGEAITKEDYGWMSNVQNGFDSTLLLPRDASVIADRSYLQMALIADVATDAFEGRVLEEGIGTPQRIVVVVKDASGGTRLTVGFVYSWYEFASERRWSDSEWKKPIYSGDEKAKQQEGIVPPSWYSLFARTAGAS